MKIAVVTTIPIVPAHAGSSKRILGFLRAVRQLGHEVDVIFLPSLRDIELDEAGHIAEFGAGHFIRLPNTPLGRARHGAKRIGMELWRRFARATGIGNPFYLYIDEYFHMASLGALRQLQLDRGYDAVLAQYVITTRAFDAFPKRVLRLVDAHDVLADRHLMFGPTATKNDYWFSVPAKVEADAMRRADVVIAIQNDDATSFRARLGEAGPEVVTVSHLIEISERIQDFSAANAAFIGSSFRPNVNAVAYFTEKVLPLVLVELPQFRLHLAGSICKAVPNHPNVVKLGFVDEVIDAFRGAPLSLNPMLSGTGINIKLLDSMACGVGTVGTATGARGLGAEFSAGLVTVADDDAAAFAAAVVRLCRDETARRALGDRAFEAAHLWNARQMENLRACLGLRPRR